MLRMKVLDEEWVLAYSELAVILAEEYGDGKSEKLIGKAIKDNREKVVIASKFSPQNHAYDDVISACNRTLKNLKSED